MDVSIQMISNLELGKKAVRPENLIKICGILQISSDYILTGRMSNSDGQNMCAKMEYLSVDDRRLLETLADFLISCNTPQ